MYGDTVNSDILARILFSRHSRVDSFNKMSLAIVLNKGKNTFTKYLNRTCYIFYDLHAKSEYDQGLAHSQTADLSIAV